MLAVVSPMESVQGGGKQGIIANGYETSFLSDENVLELGCGNICTTQGIY